MESYNPISDHPPPSPQSHDEEKEDEEKGEEDDKAKFTADKPQMDKPSSVSAATTGMIWSDEQVTQLLQCMIEFKAKKGVDADADPTAFHEFFERKFQFRYSKSRVYEKVRRLKMKYFNNLKKFEKVGKDTGISKAELQKWNSSRQISGGRAGAGDFESNYLLLSQSFEVDSRGIMKFAGKTGDELSLLKENMHLIDDDKAKELEQKWKTLHAVHFFKSLELMKEQTGQVLEAMMRKK